MPETLSTPLAEVTFYSYTVIDILRCSNLKARCHPEVPGKFIKIVSLNVTVKELIIYRVRYSEFVCDVIASLCTVCLTCLDLEHVSCFGMSRLLQTLFATKLPLWDTIKVALYFTFNESDQYYIY